MLRKYPALFLAALLLLTAVLYAFYLIPAFLAILVAAGALLVFAAKCAILAAIND